MSETNLSFNKVRKRDNRLVDFNISKIEDAIFASFNAVGSGGRENAKELADVVCYYLGETITEEYPSIEDIQDVVEKVLVQTNQADAAKAYILYREQRTRQRRKLQIINVTTGSIVAWNKSQLLHSLIIEDGLSEADAAKISTDVEKVLFNMGMQEVSCDLLKELVANQLHCNGFVSQAKILRLKYLTLDNIITSPDALQNLYNYISKNILYNKLPNDIASAVDNKILKPISSIGDIDNYFDKDKLSITKIELDCMKIAKQIGQGKLDQFKKQIYANAKLAWGYFKLEIEQIGKYLSAIDNKKYSSIIKKCLSTASPLDSLKSIGIQINILNLNQAIKYCLGTENVEVFSDEIINNLNVSNKPVVDYWHIDIFLK